MSSIVSASKALLDGSYEKAFLRINHNCDAHNLGNYIFKLENNPSTCKRIAARLVMYIPLMLTSVVSIVKDTVSAVVYLVAAILSGLAFVLTFGTVPSRFCLNASLLLVDSLWNIGIDVLGIICPYASAILCRNTYEVFKGSFFEKKAD